MRNAWPSFSAANVALTGRQASGSPRGVTTGNAAAARLNAGAGSTTTTSPPPSSREMTNTMARGTNSTASEMAMSRVPWPARAGVASPSSSSYSSSSSSRSTGAEGSDGSASPEGSAGAEGSAGGDNSAGWTGAWG